MKSREELIEKINVLGPWTHGYFDLGNGLIIQDQDELQQKRLFIYKKYFEDIISKHYNKEDLTQKTICEIGCNTGFFLYEMYKKFKFREATGLEPRKDNLTKANFIADYFKLSSKEYKLKKFDILTTQKRLPNYNVVLMPGVLHHIDDHIHALTNIYNMTKDVCIIESLVLPDELNNSDVSKHLELKDEFYQENKDYFGIVGYKIESNYLDGSSFYSGVVAIPTVKALIMLLHHVGFSHVEIYKDPEQLIKEIYSPNYYRIVNAVIIKAVKRSQERKIKHSEIETIYKNTYEEEFQTYIPINIIGPIYEYCFEGLSLSDLPKLSRLIVYSEKYYKSQKGRNASDELKKLDVFDEKQDRIIKTFKHAFSHKTAFEYAKTCYHLGQLNESKSVAKTLTGICNLDWRTVYKTYYLLGLISYDKGDISSAKHLVELSLHAYHNYYPAIRLRRILNDS